MVESTYFNVGFQTYNRGIYNFFSVNTPAMNPYGRENNQIGVSDDSVVLTGVGWALIYYPTQIGF